MSRLTGCSSASRTGGSVVEDLSRTPSATANAGCRPIRSPHYGHMTDTILLTVPSGLRGAGVIALVLGGLGSRLDLPVDRIDELALASATLAPSVQAEALELEADVLDDRLVVRIGPLEDGTAADASLRRVVDALVDNVAGIRRGDHEWLELELIRSEAG